MRKIKFSVAAIAAALPLAAGASALGQDIVHSAGGADITWFYDSELGSWDVVFRAKGTTVATGLTNPYPGPPGGVGGSSSDYVFDTLTIDVAAPGTDTLNSIFYYTAGPSGFDPDPGIRTRLRELDADQNEVDQFDTLRIEIDWDNSIKPIGSEFALWNRDDFGNPDQVLYETADGQLSHDWPAWGHSHWVWGFSQPGDYTLKLDFVGINDGEVASSPGSVLVNFSIVPEPATAMLLLAAGSVVTLRRRR
ncbi:MAG: PEP-CTERM sorting domain-containing protein [Phycisphaeraceae bacterium]|nr:PEP-CTERM sorting domain-containing protein [Phycisphaeraceae bacterium]